MAGSERIIWPGNVSAESYWRVTQTISKLVAEDPQRCIELIVTSDGGRLNVALAFFDVMRYVIKPNLETVAAGDVASAGLFIYLSGIRRAITRHSGITVHRIGQSFDQPVTLYLPEQKSLVEDTQNNMRRCAKIIVESTNGGISYAKAFRWMESGKQFTAEEAFKYTLAHEIRDGTA